MLTKQLSDFLCGLRYEDLPEQAVCQAKMCVEDLVGVAVAGSARPHGKIWRSYISGLPQGPESAVWDGRWDALSCENAAALNAAYAHVIDMDDVHNASITHLGAVTIPAALAVGQKYRRSGREVIAAIAAGYEAGARVGEAINPGAYHYWHTTGVVGSFSSAVAAGKLIGLSPEQMLSAMGSAGTQSAGLWQFIRDGAMSKTLHTANAAMAGIRAADPPLHGAGAPGGRGRAVPRAGRRLKTVMWNAYQISKRSAIVMNPNEELIRAAVHDAVIRAVTEISADVKNLLEQALARETNETARSMLTSMLDNLSIAREADKAVCQSPGYPTTWLSYGEDNFPDCVGGAVMDALAEATPKGYLRPSIVDPLTRRNPGGKPCPPSASAGRWTSPASSAARPSAPAAGTIPTPTPCWPD